MRMPTKNEVQAATVRIFHKLGIGLRSLAFWFFEFILVGLMPIWLYKGSVIAFGSQAVHKEIPPPEIAALSLVITGLNIVTGLGWSFHSHGRPPSILNKPLLFANILILLACGAFYIGASLTIASFDAGWTSWGLLVATIFSMPTSLLSWEPTHAVVGQPGASGP